MSDFDSVSVFMTSFSTFLTLFLALLTLFSAFLAYVFSTFCIVFSSSHILYLAVLTSLRDSLEFAEMPELITSPWEILI